MLLNTDEQFSSLVNTKEHIWISKEAKYEKLIRKLYEIVEKQNVRGSLLVATDNQIVFASGTRSVETSGEEVSPYTIYEIGSITKTFTATCIFKLIDEGKIRLDDTIDKFFPNYSYSEKITVYELLHMRSGLWDFVNDFDIFWKERSKSFEEEFWSGKIEDSELLENLYKSDLKFEPDTEMSYSNTNYVLLALIIEKITGMPYNKYVQKTIFDPLGMKNSSSVSFDDVNSKAEEEYGYHLAQHIARGAGDIHSNVLDMLKLDRALFSNRIISKESLEIMLNDEDGYGCGWMSEAYPDCWWCQQGEEVDRQLYFHPGETLSFVSCNIVMNVYGQRLYVIMMSPCLQDIDASIILACKEYIKEI